MDPVPRPDLCLTRFYFAPPQVTLLFADIKGFTPMCKEVEPRQVMTLLNALYSRYDAMLDAYGVYKVETIGDCYFVAGGLIREDEDGMAAVREGGSSDDPLHAERVFMFAKAMLSAAKEVIMPTTGQPVEIRIGIHTGPVVSGVVGTRMPRFCLFGDTVNTASRMESSGQPGAIHASEATFRRLQRTDLWEPTGGIEVKGKGLMQTFVWRPTEPTYPIHPIGSAAAQPLPADPLQPAGSTESPSPFSMQLLPLAADGFAEDSLPENLTAASCLGESATAAFATSVERQAGGGGGNGHDSGNRNSPCATFGGFSLARVLAGRATEHRSPCDSEASFPPVSGVVDLCLGLDFGNSLVLE
ncbi:hypothetical protein GPECTOR_18g76 [Gonium pectorale]|uniref:Guanylate cyclase domain-containing protein n=1 Tax=Gonium pectorale TaxID=33097 RepID=A0A150GL78_GONPE|nr:hypothetical protein GPECTOR_18g76 [Gonium pectorale]|eukprot:KXZ50100.1 hypothetical protein GPECTOR_18g76 [Gonium pectorale]